MIELFQFEQCPYCKKVREKLTELCLDYVCRNSKGKAQSELLKKIGGKEQVPFLIDTTTSVMLYESQEIVDYLEKTYGGR